MGSMVYTLLWVMQDLYHQLYGLRFNNQNKALGYYTGLILGTVRDNHCILTRITIEVLEAKNAMKCCCAV